MWDANQRLIESHSNGTVTRYGYDSLGRRLFKETGETRTQFYWDGDALLGESEVVLDSPKESLPTKGKVVALAERLDKAKSATPHKAREYVYYPETFEPLALIDGEGEPQRVYHYHNDPNGCPTRLTDNSGKVQWAASYTVWGGTLLLHVNGVDNPLRLQGQYWDEETGLYYNRHRYYLAELGQFGSIDPVGLDPGENVYEFAANTLEWVDPSGLACTRLVKNGQKTILEIIDKFQPGSRESRQLRRFVEAWNEEIARNGGRMTRRTLTSAEEQASNIWKRQMRKRYPARFKGKVVGHTPDATMGGAAAGGRAMALGTPVNSYLGGAAGGVPTGTTYHGVRLVR